MKARDWFGASLLVVALLLTAGCLAVWKQASLGDAAAAMAQPFEPVESISTAIARPRSYRPNATAIGTVVALRSVTLRNELPGTVRQVNLDPGQVVDTGTVLVALDVSVESAELNALKSEAALAASILERATGLRDNHAIAEDELDRARANYDVSRSRIARTQAIIERKTIRAPFRARVGIADLHPGQYLLEGTEITSLQGVDDAVHIDFEVEQQVAAGLAGGDRVQVVTDGRNGTTVNADIVAVDARVDPRTRNATVRARIDDADGLERVPGPGASVQVVVPAGAEQDAVVVPASALRKGPAGDHIYVILEDPDGNPRAHQRPVEVAALQGDEVVISAGVEVGDEVAAAGSFKLREAVLIAQADSQHADAAR